MDPIRLKTLLNEAEALGIYAARAGKLPEESRIFEVIDSMRQSLERGEPTPGAPLFAEMGKVSLAAGITPAQLMRRETRLGRMRQQAALVTPYLIGLITLLLTLYLAFQSSELHKADLALREHQDLVSQHPQEKLYLAWKMYKYERVLTIKAPPLAQLDGYQKLVDDSRRLYGKSAAVSALLQDSSAIRYVPDLFESHGPCWLQSFFRAINNAEPSTACNTSPVEDKLQETSAAADIKIPCIAQPGPTLNDKLPNPESRFDLDDYKASIECFMRSLAIANAYDEPMDRELYETRNKVTMLVSWLLPGLYGLLGACVLVMRGLLHVNGQSHVGGDARIVDLLSLPLRIALGGLAGIIIGWFWVPTSSTANATAITISSIPFGMAFLAGYSIEKLFALLDGLLKPTDKPVQTTVPPDEADKKHNVKSQTEPAPNQPDSESPKKPDVKD